MSQITIHTTAVAEESEEMTEAAIIKAEAEILEAEVTPMIDGEDDQRLAEWYVEKMAYLKTVDETIMKQAKAMRNQIKSRKAALAWKFRSVVEGIVRTLIVSQGGKRKSIKFLTGNAGYRKTASSIVVTDEVAFMEWFEKQPVEIQEELRPCFDLKIARKTPIKHYIETNGDIPEGIEYTEAHEKFYPTADVPALEDLAKK